MPEVKIRCSHCKHGMQVTTSGGEEVVQVKCRNCGASLKFRTPANRSSATPSVAKPPSDDPLDFFVVTRNITRFFTRIGVLAVKAFGACQSLRSNDDSNGSQIESSVVAWNWSRSNRVFGYRDGRCLLVRCRKFEYRQRP